MPFVLTGNLETDTMCRFGMAEIQQGGGVRTSTFDQGRWLCQPPKAASTPLSDMPFLPGDKSSTFIDTVWGQTARSMESRIPRQAPS
jgi:hypothetical protein